jgi:hypothetical protein
MIGMLVTVTGFGSVWRCRLGKNPDDPRRFTHAAYYNTTGVPVDGKIRTRPKIIGHARFNGVGGFNPNYLSRMTNRVFECAEPCIWQGQNKVLFKRMLDAPGTPDCFLVTVTPEHTGRLDIGADAWKSDDALLLSFSEWRDQQEAMLLMPAHAWLRSVLGTFSLEPSSTKSWMADLRLRC